MRIALKQSIVKVESHDLKQHHVQPPDINKTDSHHIYCNFCVITQNRRKNETKSTAETKNATSMYCTIAHTVKRNY